MAEDIVQRIVIEGAEEVQEKIEHMVEGAAKAVKDLGPAFHKVAEEIEAVGGAALKLVGVFTAVAAAALEATRETANFAREMRGLAAISGDTFEGVQHL